jgi:hypothetical protein
LSDLTRQQIETGLAKLGDRLHLVNLGDGARWRQHLKDITPDQLAVMLEQLPGAPSITLSTDPQITTKSSPELNLKVKAQDYHLRVILRPGELHLLDLQVRPQKNGQSIARQLIAWMVDFAACAPQLKEEDKTPRISTAAGLTNGAYTWARFGFTPHASSSPDIQGWSELKQAIRRVRLSADSARIAYDPVNLEACEFTADSPYMRQHPKGFELTAEEQAAIQNALDSDDPKALWVISDLGRVVAPCHHPASPITVGKAILCGLSWVGEVRLDARDPGYQRLMAYLEPVRQQTYKMEGARGI